MALDASIKASRSDDVRKGFAVVADEVRKFSEENKSASSDINDTINEKVYNVDI